MSGGAALEEQLNRIDILQRIEINCSRVGEGQWLQGEQPLIRPGMAPVAPSMAESLRNSRLCTEQRFRLTA